MFYLKKLPHSLESRSALFYSGKPRIVHSSKTMIDDEKCKTEEEEEDDSSGDDRWEDNYALYVRPLLETLADWNLEEHMEEMVYLIFHDDCWETRKRKGLYGLCSDNLIEWVSNRRFQSNEDKRIMQKSISSHGIDGDLFMYCIVNERYELISSTSPISLTSQLLLGLLALYWEFDVPFSISSSLSLASLGVPEGLVSDLRHLSPSLARDMIHYDSLASISGEGSIYGQLITIGHLEYRQQARSSWIPFGAANARFTLHRRKVATGIRLVKDVATMTKSCHDPNDHSTGVISSGMDDSQEYEPTHHDFRFSGEGGYQEFATEIDHHEDQSSFFLAADPLYDRFQIGRARHSSNDIVIPGPLHLNSDGYYTGPVSRWACRIDCERLPPFRSFISVGGMTDQQHLSVDCTSNESMTGHGIWILQPELGYWVEVTAFFPNSNDNVNAKRGGANFLPCGNLLTDGTLIDIGGVLLLFQSPLSMARSIHQSSNPVAIIESLQGKRPHCPVQFHPIHFTFTDALTRHQRARQRIYEEDYYQIALQHSKMQGKHNVDHCFPVIYGDFLHPLYTPVNISPMDFSTNTNNVNQQNKNNDNNSCQDDEENHRAYVYPSCGHVYAFHPSLLSSNVNSTARTNHTNSRGSNNSNFYTNNNSHSQCPLCRTVGVFVPLIFPDDLSSFSPVHHMKKKIIANAPLQSNLISASGKEIQTNGVNELYVFNPCGHVTDLHTCRQWAAIPLPLHRRKCGAHRPDQDNANATMAEEIIGGYVQVHSVHEVVPLVTNASHRRHLAANNRQERSDRDNNLDTYGDSEYGDTPYERHEHNRDNNDNVYAKGLCPYCATPLDAARPFSKIIVQFDDCNVDNNTQGTSNTMDPYFTSCSNITSSDSLESFDNLKSSSFDFINPKKADEKEEEEVNLWQWNEESLHSPETNLQAILYSQRYLFVAANVLPNKKHKKKYFLSVSEYNNNLKNNNNFNVHNPSYVSLSASTSMASSVSCTSQSNDDFPPKQYPHHLSPFSIKKSFPVYAPHVFVNNSNTI